MGILKKPLKEKLICGFIYKETGVYEKAKKSLASRFGKIDFESREIDFNYTRYYAAEMGEGLKRRFVSFEKLIDPDKLADAKIFSNKVEEKHLYPGTKNRMINIDPGLICESKLVLATTKNFSHRVYIGKGIYAEVTLLYKNGGFKTLEWTYPDYASDKYIDIISRIRSLFTAGKSQKSHKKP
ncbi:MAG TPA: DUF4416 family protein [Candidatus Goldiibacteriota bacterium]|nr:DUF4416 family protein [Candidatus Goldiibacteriota bacterium]